MRNGILLAFAVGSMLLGGCATQHYAADTANAAPRSVSPDQRDVPAPALAFDPPVTQDQGQLALDREPREASAFAGYDEPTISYSYLRSDDRVDGSGFTHLDREAVTERIAVSTR